MYRIFGVTSDRTLALSRVRAASRDTVIIKKVWLSMDGNLRLEFQTVSDTRPEQHQLVLSKARDRRIKVMSNLNLETGVYQIRNGTQTVSGQPLPWLTQCDRLTS